MAKLVLSKGGSVLHQCFIDKDRIGLGRDAHNHVVVDDPTLGGEHAEIISIANDHILQDLGTASGTWVNGEQVDRHILQHGDVIKLGSFFVRYLNPRVSGAMDLERTMLIAGLVEADALAANGPGGGRGISARVPTSRTAKVRFPKGKLKVLAGKLKGAIVDLDRVVATLGKRGHRMAVITRRPHGYFLTHVEGGRFPKVNGQSVGKEARILQSGDVIEVADEKVQIFVE